MRSYIIMHEQKYYPSTLVEFVTRRFTGWTLWAIATDSLQIGNNLSYPSYATHPRTRRFIGYTMWTKQKWSLANCRIVFIHVSDTRIVYPTFYWTNCVSKHWTTGGTMTASIMGTLLTPRLGEGPVLREVDPLCHVKNTCKSPPNEGGRERKRKPSKWSSR